VAINTNPENLLGAPSGYYTPQQLAEMRQYAQQLSGRSQTPVRHWSQGVANMLNAGLGGYYQGRADRLDRENIANAAGTMQPAFNPPSSTGDVPGYTQTGNNYYVPSSSVNQGAPQHSPLMQGLFSDPSIYGVGNLTPDGGYTGG
jgi:hypothetical protein